MPSKKELKKERDDAAAWNHYIDKMMERNMEKYGMRVWTFKKAEKEEFFAKREEKRARRQGNRDHRKAGLQTQKKLKRKEVRADPEYQRLPAAKKAAMMEKKLAELEKNYVYKGKLGLAQEAAAKAAGMEASDAHEEENEEEEEEGEEEGGDEMDVDHHLEDDSDDEQDGQQPASNPVGGVLIAAC